MDNQESMVSKTKIASILRERATKLIARRKDSPAREPVVIDANSVIIKASQIVLVVDNFSPEINLNPVIDVTSPDVKVDVGSPNVTVDSRPEIRVDVPKQDNPNIINQITVPEPSVKEVNVNIPTQKNKTKTITVHGPNGDYTATMQED